MRFKNVAPIVLTAISVASSIAAVIMAVNDTPKAVQILDDHRLEVDPYLECEEDPLSTKDKLLDYGKAYWKTEVLLGVSVATSIASCAIGHRNYRALAAATATLYAAYSKHKGKVKEIIGEEKAKLIEQAVKKDLMIEHKNPTEMVWFQEPVTGEFFQMSWVDYMQRKIDACLALGDPKNGQLSLGELFPEIRKRCPLAAKSVWDASINMDIDGTPFFEIMEEKFNSRASEDDCPIDPHFNEGRETWLISYSVYPLSYNSAVDCGYLSPKDE